MRLGNQTDDYPIVVELVEPGNLDIEFTVGYVCDTLAEALSVLNDLIDVSAADCE